MAMNPVCPACGTDLVRTRGDIDPDELPDAEDLVRLDPDNPYSIVLCSEGCAAAYRGD